MSIAQTIRPHLPYLRRFARTLTGAQESGDAYVATLLEGLVSTPSDFPTDVPPRVALYHLFLRVWNSVRLNTQGGDPGQGSLTTAQRRINSISSLPRQAFLLVAVEGFTAAEAAMILEIGESDIESLLDIAGQEIAHQVATNVLIIEDELLIAMDLEIDRHEPWPFGSRRRNDQDRGSCRSQTSEARSYSGGRQASRWQQRSRCRREIVAEGDMPVIFITAYPERC